MEKASQTSTTTSPSLPVIALLMTAGALGAYITGYGWARLNVFHTVESYPNGKGEGVYYAVTKPDQLPGQGWEYQLFRPAIAMEETLTNRSYRR